MPNRQNRKPAATPKRLPQPRIPSSQKIPWLKRAIDDAIQSAATNLNCNFYRVTFIPLSDRAQSWLDPQLRLANGFFQSFGAPITTNKSDYVEHGTPRHESALAKTAMLEACTLRNLRQQTATASSYLPESQLTPELLELRSGYLDQPGCLAVTIGFKEPFPEDFILILIAVEGDAAAENALCAQAALPAIDTFCRNVYGDLSVTSL